jgi:hypothetical protein
LKHWLLVALFAGLLAASWPEAGSAQDTVVRARQREAMMACAEDRARFCGNVLPGGGRIIACVRANADKLSQRCFQAMTAWALAQANAIRACVPDAERLCPHLPPRGPRARACLLRNTERLSKACGEALLGSEPLNGDGALKLCQPDFDRLCPSLPAGSQALRSCILLNADKLSRPCSDALFGD